MHIFDSLFTQPWVELLGTVALHFLWQGALIAIVLAIVLKVLPTELSRTRYTLGMSALIVMLIVPSTAFIKGYAEIDAVEVTAAEVFSAAPIQHRSTGADGIQAVPMPSPGNVAESTALEPEESPLWEQVRTWFGVAWILGALFMALRLGWAWIHVSRLKSRFSEPVSTELQQVFEQLMERAGIRTQVVLRQTNVFAEAVLIGWIKPAVLLPVSVVTQMSTDHIEAIIAHELAHVKRYDHMFAGIQAIVETVLFYHPAVWWVSHQVRVEREHCCDDLAAELLNDTPRYARALFELENQRTGFGRFALSAQDGSLLSRISRLTKKSTKNTTEMYPRTGVSTFIIAAVIGCSLIIGSCADFGSSTVSIGEEYDLPPRLASMVATGDRDGIVTFLHDAHNSGEDKTLEWIAGVYDRSEEEVRRSLMFVLAHVNTPEADQVLIQMAESDPSDDVREGALRSIAVRSEAVGELTAAKLGVVPSPPSGYTYPPMTEDQEQALSSSLKRIFMDEEQAVEVRQEAYRLLEPWDEQGQLADEAIMTSSVPHFKLMLIRHLNHPEKYRSELMNIYNSSTDVTEKAGALSNLSDMGALEMMPHMVDMMLDISPEMLAWDRLSRVERVNSTAPHGYMSRMSMRTAIAAFYINAPEAERGLIADQIERELAPRVELIEQRIDAGFNFFDERDVIIKQLELIIYLVPAVDANSAKKIPGLETPAIQKASELLQLVKYGTESR